MLPIGSRASLLWLRPSSYRLTALKQLATVRRLPRSGLERSGDEAGETPSRSGCAGSPATGSLPSRLLTFC